jgi:hypothetical protein
MERFERHNKHNNKALHRNLGKGCGDVQNNITGKNSDTRKEHTTCLEDHGEHDLPLGVLVQVCPNQLSNVLRDEQDLNVRPCHDTLEKRRNVLLEALCVDGMCWCKTMERARV